MELRRPNQRWYQDAELDDSELSEELVAAGQSCAASGRPIRS